MFRLVKVNFKCKLSFCVYLFAIQTFCTEKLIVKGDAIIEGDLDYKRIAIRHYIQFGELNLENFLVIYIAR